MHRELAGPIIIRKSHDGDRAALERLADLNGTILPGGEFLLADVEGELVAATALDCDNELLGDPFRQTRDARELLEVRVRQLWAASRSASGPPWVRLAARLKRAMRPTAEATRRSHAA